MSPQPILKFHPNPSLTLSPNSMHERPEVCTKIAQCIGMWSWVDTQVGTLYVTLLGSDKKRAAETWIGMTSDIVKDRSLKTAGLTVLNSGENDLLGQIITYLSSRKKTRDKLAHWFWGISPEIPNGLVMVDPRFLIAHRAKLQEFLLSDTPAKLSDARIPESKMFVWTVDCLDLVERDFQKAADVVNGFMALASRKDVAERERLRLALSADVQKM